MRRTCVLVVLCLTLGLVSENQAQEFPDFLGENEPRPQLMLLGSFHFSNPGLDTYKPKHEINILSEKRQAELEAMITRLTEYAPTKIAIEYKRTHQAKADSQYQAYLTGAAELSTNEIQQIGFRLAKRLGHERVWCVDAPTTSLLGDMSDEEFYAKVDAYDQRDMLDSEIGRRYTTLYSYGDSLKMVQTLSEHFLYMNSAERLRIGHGAYTVGTFKLRQNDDYLGPDY